MIADNRPLWRKACSGRIMQDWHHAHVARGMKGNRIKADAFKRRSNRRMSASGSILDWMRYETTHRFGI